MVCQNCGNQLPDGSKFCHFCGVKQTAAVGAGSSPIPAQPSVLTGSGESPAPSDPAAYTGGVYSGIPYEQDMEKRKQVEKQLLADEEQRAGRIAKKKKQRKKIGIIAAAVCFVAIVTAVSILWIYPAVKYQTAVSAMDKENYDKAASYFESLGEYKDSEDLAIQCKYQYACQLLDEGEFTKAKDIFQDIDSYSDSEENITACDYGIAKEYMDNEDYESAIELFISLGTYEDAAELLGECYEGYGDQLYKDGEYKDALSTYISGNIAVSDSENMIDCYYQLMLSDISSENWEEAYGKWNTIKDLKDTGEASATVLENYITLLMTGGTKDTYEEALTLIAGLDSKYITATITSLSTECTGALNELQYQDAVNYYNNGDYDSATEAFSAILGYKDASDYYNELTNWSVSVIINNSEYDNATDMSSASKYDTIYAHFAVYCSDPNDGINLWAEWIFSDGDPLDDYFDSPWYSGDEGWTSWWYDSPDNASGCTATIYVYNADTNQLLCTDTIIVS